MCIQVKTRYDIPMGKASVKFRTPDVEKDRKLIVKESKRDLQDLMEEPTHLGNLAELAKALEKVKEKKR